MGVFALGLRERTLKKIILMLVGFSAGALFGFFLTGIGVMLSVKIVFGG
ncbi:MAG: hypothetical protein V1820_00315 [archaeon]